MFKSKLLETRNDTKEWCEFKFILRGWNGDGLQIHLLGVSFPIVCMSLNG